MSKPKKTNDRVIALPFQNNLFFRSVYDWEGCTTIADYTGLWPQYRVYNEEGYYISSCAWHRQNLFDEVQRIYLLQETIRTRGGLIYD